MKLLTYEFEGSEYVGVLADDGGSVTKADFRDMNDLIMSGCTQEEIMAKCGGQPVPLETVKILAPIPHPMQDIIGVGENYKDHAAEMADYGRGASEEKKPVSYFGKHVNRAVAPGDPIEAHDDIDAHLDYEVELGVIIGKEARGVKAEDAFDYVFGYTVINDASARDMQFERGQFFYGKGLDNLTPMGPWIVTEDEMDRPPKLKLTCHVNGECRQNSSTEQFINGVAELIEDLSAGVTLKPGAIIATGTPAGVGFGTKPPRCLKPGDIVRSEVEGIGAIENPVVSTAQFMKK